MAQDWATSQDSSGAAQAIIQKTNLCQNTQWIPKRFWTMGLNEEKLPNSNPVTWKSHFQKPWPMPRKSITYRWTSHKILKGFWQASLTMGQHHKKRNQTSCVQVALENILGSGTYKTFWMKSEYIMPWITNQIAILHTVHEEELNISKHRIHRSRLLCSTQNSISSTMNLKKRCDPACHFGSICPELQIWGHVQTLLKKKKLPWMIPFWKIQCPIVRHQKAVIDEALLWLQCTYLFLITKGAPVSFCRSDIDRYPARPSLVDPLV